MRFVNWLCRSIVFVGLVACAIAGFLYSRDQLWENFLAGYDDVKTLLQIPEGTPFRQILAAIFTVVAAGLLWTLLPRKWWQREREISFSGSHGEVSIALEPVEATLNRVVQKLPDVKWIELHIIPQEGMNKVRVVGKAILYKDADSDARMVTARVLNFITLHTRKILGVSNIEPKIKVQRWVMKMKTVKPEPLLLEGPEGEQRFSNEPQRSVARRPSQESVAAARQAQVDANDDELTVDPDWRDKRPDEFVIEGNERS
jgi:hypothetical protein